VRTFVGLALLAASVQAAVLVPVTDPGLYFSPYNSYADGDRAVVWIYAGSYLKTVFRGTAAAVRMDVRTVRGARAKFRWTVDGGPWQTGEGETGELRVAAGLPAGEHRLEFHLAATDANYDRWERPDQAVRILGLTVDDGAGVSAHPGVSKKRAVFFGDSITEGAWNLGASFRVVEKKWVDWVAHSDATQAWPRILAEALGMEYGMCGSGGMSWLRPSHSGIPALPASWRFHYQGQARTFSPEPDVVFVNMGTNDGTREIGPAVTAWLREARKAMPGARIAVIVPFGQMAREALGKAVRDAGDGNVQLVDLGPRWAVGLTKYGKSTAVSYDGLHPDASANGMLAAALAAGIADLL